MIHPSLLLLCQAGKVDGIMAIARYSFLFICLVVVLINSHSIIAQGDGGAPTPSDDDEEFSEFIDDEEEFPEREETSTTDEGITTIFIMARSIKTFYNDFTISPAG